MKKTKPGLKNDTYERNAKKQIETEYGGMAYTDLFLVGWQAHHIHPVNWGGSDDDSNFQYLKASQHHPFTTWFTARKKEINEKLKEED